MSFRSKQVENLNSVLGHSVENETLYGVHNDYHFSINLIPYGNASIFQLTLTVDKPISSEAIRILHQNYKIKAAYELVTVGSTNVYVVNVILNLPMSKDKKKVYFETLINNLTNVFKEYDILDNSNCCLCGSEKEDEEVTYNIYKGLYIATHKTCIEASYEQERALIEAENANISKLPISIVFAIVGAFVGLIPAMIVVVGFGWLFGILFALSPFCAFFGYKLGKAPLRWYATLTAAVSSVIATVLIVVVCYALLASLAEVSFADLIADPESGFTSLLLQGVLFDVVGIAIAWNYITKTTNTKVQK